MTKLNFDITDPNCDVEKLFINFREYYDEEIIHGDVPWSLSGYNVWTWLESKVGGETTFDEWVDLRQLCGAPNLNTCDELLSAWSQAGFIKGRGKGRYVFTTKGLKLKRRRK
jgi:hypothetical protein